MEAQIAIAQKKRSIATTVLAGVIILSAFFGCWRSVNALKANIMEEFYADIGIASDLSVRSEYAYNLVTIAKKYIDADNEAITAVIEARNELDSAETTLEMYDANNELTEAASTLNALLLEEDLSEDDEDYRSSIMSELSSRNSTISHDDYNDLAADFNENVVELFPANIVCAIAGIEELGVFR